MLGPRPNVPSACHLLVAFQQLVVVVQRAPNLVGGFPLHPLQMSYMYQHESVQKNDFKMKNKRRCTWTLHWNKLSMVSQPLQCLSNASDQNGPRERERQGVTTGSFVILEAPEDSHSLSLHQQALVGSVVQLLEAGMVIRCWL